MTDAHAGLPVPGRWRDVARATGLLAADGTVAQTIFAEMTGLAVRTGAINLGQGFPDVDGPDYVKEAAKAAIDAGRNQYAPGDGIPELRRAVADHQRRHYGLAVDPDSEVLVTTGATEALAAAILALAGPGDDVITLEPFYDAHAAVIAMAGATHVPVPLTAEGFRLDVAALRAAASERTRLIVVNTPHNPTGTVLTREELEAIAAVAREHDAVVLTDEVYEHLTFDGAAHVPVATLPGMASRTLTVSSSGKTFSFTGWKVGWVHGPAELVTAVRTVKQFLTYTSGSPFQPAIAQALADDETPRALAASLAARRDLLCEGLTAAGFDVVVPQGTYFVVADGAPLGFEDGHELCRRLPELAGVVAVPVSAFCREGSTTADRLRSRVRFTFVKREDVLRDAVERLHRLAT
ncbi:pyridoxal phosphate-dependent aminotransferase [Isoptericola variabilis]|uniref:Aminotransferase class I and II n=1 Tax=Isoptericola variabilis (strain 225) TaxID=743718 RepID=F6FPZ3_ISOV2|nr:pyridoxal phosphate-dependent aminotransferase [Isoptericola variabilis]AEG43782.1 aminotransferase class I and II [Isoptericola variabilis 225]TWH27464.1 N-succinyldiaminopimelate aminotransferase [Isoptericola variabilis J7]